MEFKLAELQGMKDPLKRLISEKIPMKSAFRLNKLIKAVEGELDNIEAARIALIKELGKPLENDPDNFTVPPEVVPEFQKKYTEFLQETVEIEFTPIDLESFGDVEITTNDMYALDKLFTE